MSTRILDTVVASFASVVIALEEVAIGAGRIDPFVAAELTLILVAGTVGGGAGRLCTDNKHDGHGTTSWSE